jgi:hypothetical protein
MHRLGNGVLAVTLLVASAALGQSRTLPLDVEATGSLPVTLSPNKQREIKASIAGSARGLRPSEQLPRVADELGLGTIVPPSVELIALPQDAFTEIPSISSYRFVLMDDGVAVVDPATRVVVQVIKSGPVEVPARR